jgi:hypothetical protein
MLPNALRISALGEEFGLNLRVVQNAPCRRVTMPRAKSATEGPGDTVPLRGIVQAGVQCSAPECRGVYSLGGVGIACLDV